MIPVPAVASAAAAVLVVVGVLAIASYNRFVRQRQLVEESWRQVDVELARRHQVVPDLVATVRAYAAHERAVLDRVVAAEAAAERPATVAQRGGAESQLAAGLRWLFALAERYPVLQADRHFLALQHQLADTEDRLAAARRFYNGNVRALNTRIDAFPSSVVARLARVPRAAYFLADEAALRTVPRVAGHL
ncbi:MAG TPA: LemA family protein [Acidimicrobiales bacterium]